RRHHHPDQSRWLHVLSGPAAATMARHIINETKKSCKNGSPSRLHARAGCSKRRRFGEVASGGAGCRHYPIEGWRMGPRRIARSMAESLNDATLLQQFVTDREEAAFVALVRRHGPRVERICRRILRNEHDVEDVFQATFLVLARKAAGIPWRESVSPWIDG